MLSAQLLMMLASDVMFGGDRGNGTVCCATGFGEGVKNCSENVQMSTRPSNFSAFTAHMAGTKNSIFQVHFVYRPAGHRHLNDFFFIGMRKRRW